MPKTRVNISIDEAVHIEVKNFLKLTGGDFSEFVEQMSVRFLGGMRPMIKRMEAAQAGDAALTPTEVRVMFMQIFGAVNIEAGAEINSIMAELATLEAEQSKKDEAALISTQSATEAIHTPKPKRTPGVKKK